VRLLPITLAAFALLASAASAKTNVPADIQPPKGHTLFKSAHAIGVQTYSCNGTAWTFVAPRANLYQGRQFVISHFNGPTWMHADGSFVVGKVDKPFPVAGTIPWLLLSAVDNGAGPFGDTLADVTFIQRINTRGGVAPDASTCNAESANKVVSVPYTADYTFWKAKKRWRH
jgi:Protein of unknown function (DUF3455)